METIPTIVSTTSGGLFQGECETLADVSRLALRAAALCVRDDRWLQLNTSTNYLLKFCESDGFNMKLNSTKSGTRENDDDFLPTINKVFSIARFIGICTYGFSIAFAWTISLFLILLAMVLSSIWKLVRLLSGMVTNHTGGRGLVGRLSGSIFYGNALISLLLSLRFLSSWTELSLSWLRANATVGLNLHTDVKIRRRVIFVTSFVTICACVEHMMSMMSATGFDIPPEEYFYRYIISSHGFLIQIDEYTLWLAVPIFVLSKIATLLWNFQDLIIILISMGLASRYHRLNMYVSYMTRIEMRFQNVQRLGTDKYIQVQVWRRLREAYVRQAALVRQVNLKLGALILLSNANNLYFICLQLFFGIGQERGSIINRMYYFLSLGWLLFRACSVVLAASDVYVHSKRALPNLYACPGSGYNIEIKRLINQLANDNVSLTGKGLFRLNRNLLLQVAATILKYELVLIQYDYN